MVRAEWWMISVIQVLIIYCLLHEQEKKKSNWLNMAFAAVLLILQVAAGMVNQDSSRTFWVLYPYLFTFLPVFYFLVGAFSYWSDPLRMQKAQYETGIARMKRSCIGSMVMTIISVILDIIYMSSTGVTCRQAKNSCIQAF